MTPEHSEDTRSTRVRKWEQGQRVLMSEIECLLREGDASRAINLSIPRHSVTTPVLRQLAYHTVLKRRALPVIFSDGSRPTPFPVGVLTDDGTRVSEGLPSVTLGLISFRHPEIDFLVDSYLLTNMSIHRHSSMAEEEEQAFQAAIQTLDDPAIQGGAIIRIIHTGLEPVVVGFYRGVIHCLLERFRQKRPRRLFVIPCLFAETPTEGPFTDASPGALLTSYLQCEAWY